MILCAELANLDNYIIALSYVNQFLYIKDSICYNVVVNSFLKKNGHLLPVLFLLRGELFTPKEAYEAGH